MDMDEDLGSEIMGSDVEGVEDTSSIATRDNQDESLFRSYVSEVIRHCKKGDSKKGKSWCLYTKDGKRLLGRHPSKDSAFSQEKAIKAHGG